MTGLRVPPGPASGARPDEGATAGAPTPPAGNRQLVRPGRLGALGLASADLDAHRTGAAVPAGRGQRPRFAAAAAGHRPGGGAAVLRLASGAGALASPAIPVQRVRGALVRRDLPAAVRLPGRLRGAAQCPAGPARPGRCRRPRRATWPGCPSPPGTRPPSTRPAALDAAAAVLRRRKFRLRTGDGWVSAEKGYRRELGNLVFHLALLAPAVRGGAGRPVRLQGQPAAGRRDLVRRTR